VAIGRILLVLVYCTQKTLAALDLQLVLHCFPLQNISEAIKRTDFFSLVIVFRRMTNGLTQCCQIFLDTIYQNEVKYTKLPQHYQMAIKYTK
jgi:hypothetical protein